MERRWNEDAAERALLMPLPLFATLVVAVIAAAGATVALAAWAGAPLAVLGFLALLASVWPGLRRWK
jgi:hypothetical protein